MPLSLAPRAPPPVLVLVPVPQLASAWLGDLHLGILGFRV